MANLLQKEFVKIKNGNYFIPNPNIKHFNEQTFKKAPLVKLSYSSLIKFYFYTYLLQYKGKDNYILYLKKKLDEGDEKSIEIFNKLPINNGILLKINKTLNLDIKTTSDENIENLEKIDNNIHLIVSDQNLRDYTDIVHKFSKTAQDSEDVARIMLRHIWRKSYDVIDSHDKGIDLWRMNRETGERNGIKIKSISESVKYRVRDQIIIIDGTLMEIPNYNSNFEKLPYDYLVFFDRSHKMMNKRTKKIVSAPQIHILKATAINKITVSYIRNRRKVEILLNNWALTPNYYGKIYRTYNVPFKFTGKKFI